ncbi:MAG: FAD-dependent oxidoreductase [Anaerolineales bacterium]|nr:FAD-dependent oxidoreductase [Anaerolineales bacterium]MCS7248651.1 FAD-dependent oxidoreductase [Anaerolineales bacterium]MDW8162464.1 FAD-dependent oxidoreductase [Anaerolineales bacterium]MDW8447899.1 FAD-dependent oxidoreductase [Anaerolineales bacterium]
MENSSLSYTIAVIGAGPAGLFASRQLAESGAQVIVFNRDIKPGGLAEYGIYPDKVKMKEGLRKQFHQILEMPNVHYFGNLLLGRRGDLTLGELQALGFDAIIVAVGAQGTKRLGIPGESIPKGVYHAKDLVYHYNQLPPYSQREFFIGRRVAIVGVGNVMLDVARYCIREKKVDEVIAVARRGPAEVKFFKKEMESVIANLDLDALDEEIRRVKPIMLAIGQDPEEARAYILAALPKAVPPTSHTRFRFEFLAAPTRILGEEKGYVTGLEIEDTTLVRVGNETRAKLLGSRRNLYVDTVIFSIGDQVDEEFGLPVQWNEFVKSPNPKFPVEGISYEAYDPEAGKWIEGIFVAGWSREASSGLVGVARKDGERCAQAVLQYLRTLKPRSDPNIVLGKLLERLRKLGKPVVTQEHLPLLTAAERAKAAALGVEDFRFSTNEEMLQVMGLLESAAP